MEKPTPREQLLEKQVGELLNPAMRGDLEERGLGLMMAGDAVGLFGSRLEAESRVGGARRCGSCWRRGDDQGCSGKAACADAMAAS